jgi:hypothetical protein
MIAFVTSCRRRIEFKKLFYDGKFVISTDGSCPNTLGISGIPGVVFYRGEQDRKVLRMTAEGRDYAKIHSDLQGEFSISSRRPLRANGPRWRAAGKEIQKILMIQPTIRSGN